MEAWNPDWEKKWVKSEELWNDIKVVYNFLYLHQREYGLNNYIIEANLKERKRWDEENRIIRIYWEYSNLGKLLIDILPKKNKELHFNLKKPVRDFFNKYFIIINEEEIKRVNKLVDKNLYPSDFVEGTIYGIFIHDKIVYVGKTVRSLEERWQEHLNFVNNSSLESSQQKYLYRDMRNNLNACQCLILKQGMFSSNKALENAEKKIIEVLLPKYNYEGVKVPYKFSSDKKH